jgi:hypothetical protein
MTIPMCTHLASSSADPFLLLSCSLACSRMRTPPARSVSRSAPSPPSSPPPSPLLSRPSPSLTDAQEDVCNQNQSNNNIDPE